MENKIFIGSLLLGPFPVLPILMGLQNLLEGGGVQLSSLHEVVPRAHVCLFILEFSSTIGDGIEGSEGDVCSPW